MPKGAFVGLLCGVCDHHRESHSTATECQSHIVSERVILLMSSCLFLISGALYFNLISRHFRAFLGVALNLLLPPVCRIVFPCLFTRDTVDNSRAKCG